MWKALVPAPRNTISILANEAAMIDRSLNRNGEFNKTFLVTDLNVLRHYENFTSMTVGDEQVQVGYRTVVPGLAIKVL
jgi:hypothetical protein